MQKKRSKVSRIKITLPYEESTKDKLRLTRGGNNSALRGEEKDKLLLLTRGEKR